MEPQTLTQSLLIAASVGIASGAVGSFVILRRMALVGDALSHVALPGIAIGLAWGFDPFWGVLVFLLGAAPLIWWLEGKTRLYADAIVGLLFVTSLALGVLFIPDAELLESLFGEFPSFSPLALFLVVFAAIAATLLVFVFTKRFLFAVVAPELARIDDKKMFGHLFLMLIFAFTVALGIKLVGTLLMGALTVIPAAIAKNISRSTVGYIVISTVLGGAVSFGGALLAFRAGFLAGPTIILVGVAVFLLSLAFARRF
ncbi:MAG: metal ABC transporter permease [Candidatus Niyogibacteria bacterium]|nr:metal ABC transporter permease [Candidatus Niyogibacteria bacterium]